MRDERGNATIQGTSMDNVKINSFGRGLVMTSLNINSLLAHIEELCVFMSNSKIDLLTIKEAKWTSLLTTARHTHLIIFTC